MLDEQLLGRNIDLEISKWYKGTVRFIIDLRPHSVIKDDAIPKLLRQQNQPVFVTINEKDFWRKVAVDNTFCIVCFALKDSQVNAIPQLLRSLLHNSKFKTKEKRMGKVIRLKNNKIEYYKFNNTIVRKIE